mgnify:CR=1 FL=1
MGESDHRALYRLLRGLLQVDQGQKELPLECLSLRSFAARRLRAGLPGVDRELVDTLGVMWRATRMPRWLDESFRREWDLFLVPEVGFFYPHRHRLLPPATITQTCRLLSDREYLAVVIADGNLATAATYLCSRFDAFWLAIVPQKEALPYSTAWDRMGRAMTLLAALIDQRCLADFAAVAPALPITGTLTPDVQPPKPSTTSKT